MGDCDRVSVEHAFLHLGVGMRTNSTTGQTHQDEAWEATEDAAPPWAATYETAYTSARSMLVRLKRAKCFSKTDLCFPPLCPL